MNLMLQALVARAGGRLEVTQGDVAELRPATLVIDYDKRGNKWILTVRDGAIEETATIVEPLALPAP